MNSCLGVYIINPAPGHLIDKERWVVAPLNRNGEPSVAKIGTDQPSHYTVLSVVLPCGRIDYNSFLSFFLSFYLNLKNVQLINPILKGLSCLYSGYHGGAKSHLGDPLCPPH